ncbi:MAG: family 20 glycosylhydrolase [Agriterribacter sp.]
MKNIFLVLTLSLSISGIAQQTNGRLQIIPQPSSLKQMDGIFSLLSTTPVYSDMAFKQAADLFAAQAFLSPSKKLPGNIIGTAANGIYFIKKNIAGSVPESYQLIIHPGYVQIIAADIKGAIHGMETLLQVQQLQPDKTKLPCGEIKDEPRFTYRGLMLDVSRNFYTVRTVEKMIDMMALYKLNTLHLHLTDAAGWRIEIKKYPQLTSNAAWRLHQEWKDWWFGPRLYTTEGSVNAYGGYYTQDEAKQLVKYAADRGITIIPEIEMPGHSDEVTAIFPSLSCSGKPYTQGEVCLGNDSTFVFLENVLKEIINIFPSTYIHIGGDEASKEAWEKCTKCQARIKNEHLKDEHELQSYGIRRMEKFLTAHNRRLLGWDEILEGGLAPGANVMSWRGENGGIEAAKAGHDVIMTPGGYCYFDGYQANPVTQPEAFGGFLPISKVYSYDPVPAVLNTTEAKHILGVQANVWTEYIPTVEHLEYMIFPRLLALSEAGWTNTNNKSWTGFEERLQQQYLLLQRNGIHYYRPIANLEIKASADTIQKASLVKIISERYKPDIRYTTDGTEPTASSMRFEKPFYVKDTALVKAAILFPETGKTGPVTTLQMAYHKAVGTQVTYNQPYSKGYPAQKDYTLVNGEKGSFTYGDGQWQGFEGGDMDVTLTLKESTPVQRVSVSFMQLTGPGVFMPEDVRISWSEDGKKFSEPVVIPNVVSERISTLVIKPFEATINHTAKFIRIVAKNKQHGFLFADEVMVF